MMKIPTTTAAALAAAIRGPNRGSTSAATTTSAHRAMTPLIIIQVQCSARHRSRRMRHLITLNVDPRLPGMVKTLLALF
ncbi:MAG: hypothetical protein HY660_18520 [Armatimonadetes bacterium]|nr:hypothetical protein [Armatimonadota bacterium]